ncbi:hypothetical protein [Clostridium butyricum]
MYKLISEEMEQLLTYNDFYGITAIPPILQDEVKKLNMNKTISIILELISLRNKTRELDFKIFKNTYPFETILKFNILNLKSEILDSPFFKSNVHIISLQMLLNLLKYILAFGDSQTINNTKYDINFNDYKKIIDLKC